MAWQRSDAGTGRGRGQEAGAGEQRPVKWTPRGGAVARHLRTDGIHRFHTSQWGSIGGSVPCSSQPAAGLTSPGDALKLKPSVHKHKSFPPPLSV